ncbi:hypothetical protein OQX61_03430 [Pedobacter sp. PLR]|uniref:hypothetical protein n=1 Tax=Pedobacter sp. PLR TaxID=2994465 RepID=UPI0022454D58|nr:hypothetical protein [Pedobacter sp. PLR]MCX2450314.1 hypothetical protein [Pedobacter sp. PLR]
MSTLTQIPVSFQEGVFFKFFKLAEFNNLSKADREIYVSNWKTYSDYVNTIDFARVEGKMENMIHIAKNLKHMGFLTDQIFAITELPVSEIEKL